MNNRLRIIILVVALVAMVSMVNYYIFKTGEVRQVFVSQVIFVERNRTDSVKVTYDVLNVDEAEALYKLRVGQKYHVCPKVVEYGKGDGAKYICEQPRFILERGCIVYSFGIAWDFGFDDAISQSKGCKVFSFDPSMGTKTHDRSNLVRFSDTGISAVDSDNYVPPYDDYVKTRQVWRVRTIGSLIKELGHSDADIDILKLDVEGAEYPALEEALLSGSLKRVKQLVMETHIYAKDRKALIDRLNVLLKLHEFGFRAYYTDVNSGCQRPNCLYVNNINYININYAV